MFKVVLTLLRFRKDADGIFSHLYLGETQEKNLIATTLEHAYFDPAAETYSPKLMPGEYECVRGFHRLPHATRVYDTFEVTNVPGHEGIIFHPGNFNGDSSGCILVGLALSQIGGHHAISGSRVAFERFQKDMEGIDVFTLHVIDD